MARTQIDEDIPILRSERNDFSLFNNTPSIQNLCNRKIQRIDMTFTEIYIILSKYTILRTQRLNSFRKRS